MRPYPLHVIGKEQSPTLAIAAGGKDTLALVDAQQ